MKKKLIRKQLATSERARTALHIYTMDLLAAQNRHEVEQAAFDAQLLAAGLIRVDHFADRIVTSSAIAEPVGQGSMNAVTLTFALKPADEFFESFLSKIPGHFRG